MSAVPASQSVLIPFIPSLAGMPRLLAYANVSVIPECACYLRDEENHLNVRPDYAWEKILGLSI